MGGTTNAVLETIRSVSFKELPLKGLRVSACLHVTSETANLMIALRDGGADAVLCASKSVIHAGRSRRLAEIATTTFLPSPSRRG